MNLNMSNDIDVLKTIIKTRELDNVLIKVGSNYHVVYMSSCDLGDGEYVYNIDAYSLSFHIDEIDAWLILGE